jgi:hypothetical protein
MIPLLDRKPKKGEPPQGWKFGSASKLLVPALGVVVTDFLVNGMASFSDARELLVLDHITGKASLTAPTNTYLALCTTVPDDTKTGATIVEATYTGYARKTIAAADWRSATGTSPAKSTNLNALTFAACTSGTSTIIGWALCDNASTSAGGVWVWGTCTSTVISTTQTPATIAVDGLEIDLD